MNAILQFAQQYGFPALVLVVVLYLMYRQNINMQEIIKGNRESLKDQNTALTTVLNINTSSLERINTSIELNSRAIENNTKKDAEVVVILRALGDRIKDNQRSMDESNMKVGELGRIIRDALSKFDTIYQLVNPQIPLILQNIDQLKLTVEQLSKDFNEIKSLLREKDQKDDPKITEGNTTSPEQL